MYRCLLVGLIFGLFSLNVAFAEVSDFYSFNSPIQKKQFEQLTHQLRCLVCQNETIADSHASLAADVRQKVYQMIQRGESSAEIKSYMVARYGDFVLFQPPVVRRTYVLWVAPFVMLLIGFIVLLFLTKSSSS